jgi:hypothetical protein
VGEVSNTLPLLDSVRAKMLQLEEVVSGPLEAEGSVLEEVVAENVLMCFQSWDPQISLESVVQAPITETVVARASIQDTVKLVATRFECQPKDA